LCVVNCVVYIYMYAYYIYDKDKNNIFNIDYRLAWTAISIPNNSFKLYIVSSPEHSSSELMPWRGVRRPSVGQLFTFSTSSQERLKGSTPNLPQMFLMMSWPSVVIFKQIWNPIWPPWSVIGWHIFNFFSRTAEGIYSNLVTNVPNEVLTKCFTF